MGAIENSMLKMWLMCPINRNIYIYITIIFGIISLHENILFILILPTFAPGIFSKETKLLV